MKSNKYLLFTSLSLSVYIYIYKTCLDFVIPSLHDTILSPSCTVRYTGVIESLSLSLSGSFSETVYQYCDIGTKKSKCFKTPNM